MPSEEDLLARLGSLTRTEKREILRGIGDDAAVLALDGPVVISKDLLIEGCHFRRGWISPWLLGSKSLRVNLSDLAAMGARPVACLLGLGLPHRGTVEVFEPFMAGFLEVAQTFDCPLVGGDLAASKEIFVSVTVIGRPRAASACRRDAGRPGDRIAVVGPLGKSRLGLELLRERTFPGLTAVARASDLDRLAPPREASWLRAHFLPEPQLAAACWLADHDFPRAMMDVSDGLAVDLLRLAQASGLRAILDAEALAAWADEEDGPPNLDIILNGGEDYSLLFTFGREDRARLGAEYPEGLNRYRVVGELEAGAPELLLRVQGGLRPVPAEGFEHFS